MRPLCCQSKQHFHATFHGGPIQATHPCRPSKSSHVSDPALPSERHAALSPKQRDENPIAIVLTTQYLKSQVVPSLGPPPHESPSATRMNRTPIKEPAYKPIPRIIEGELLCLWWGNQRSTPMMRKFIFEDQPEEKTPLAETPEGWGKILLATQTSPLSGFSSDLLPHLRNPSRLTAWSPETSLDYVSDPKWERKAPPRRYRPCHASGLEVTKSRRPHATRLYP